MNQKWTHQTLIAFLSVGFIACSASSDNRRNPDWAIIGPSGAGLLTHNQPVDLDSLQKKFPGANMAETKLKTYGELQSVISVANKGNERPLFYISFNHDYDQTPPPRISVFSVLTRNPEIKGPGGVKVRQSRLKDLRPHVALSCSFGQNDFTNTYVCLAKSESDENPFNSGSRFRALFVAPEGISVPFSRASSELREEGILTEMMYYPKQN